MKWTDEKPTMQLRWRYRRVQTGKNPLDIGVEKTLQQLWIVTRGLGGKVEYVEEWRDLPAVTE
jgi:hypothetical protein